MKTVLVGWGEAVNHDLSSLHMHGDQNPKLQVGLATGLNTFNNKWTFYIKRYWIIESGWLIYRRKLVAVCSTTDTSLILIPAAINFGKYDLFVLSCVVILSFDQIMLIPNNSPYYNNLLISDFSCERIVVKRSFMNTFIISIL